MEHLYASSDVAADAAQVETPAAPRLRLTLREKGIFAFVALLVYVVLAGLYLAHERGRSLYIVDQLKQNHADHEFLTKVNTALTHSIVALQFGLNAATPPTDLELDLQAFAPDLPALTASFPETVPIMHRLERHLAQFRQGASREALLAIRDSEEQLAAQLEKIEGSVERRGEALSKQYTELTEYVTLALATMALVGLAAFAATLGSFFSRLVRDIKALETRAVAIVRGYNGPPLAVARHDELGSLMHALNGAQTALRRWEQTEELTREQRLHQEKMAAIGSLAAAVAHEVSNPINSISGIAQYVIEALACGTRIDDATLESNSKLTLKQTERIGMIMRRLADLAAPSSPELEPNNINELVENTCGFLRYDKRFRHVELVLDLARDVPAVRAVSDHLVQVLMNLLINAADAVESVSGRNAAIHVCTRQVGAEAELSVADNGQGMDSAVLARAFADSFTTKPASKGRGIGLHLCKKLIEEMGGRIALESTPGVGTTARIWLAAVQAPPAG